MSEKHKTILTKGFKFARSKKRDVLTLTNQWIQRMCEKCKLSLTNGFIHWQKQEKKRPLTGSPVLGFRKFTLTKGNRSSEKTLKTRSPKGSSGKTG